MTFTFCVHFSPLDAFPACHDHYIPQYNILHIFIYIYSNSWPTLYILLSACFLRNDHSFRTLVGLHPENHSPV